nr:uncharacterized protein LOC112721516 [Arachis hypogaea]
MADKTLKRAYGIVEDVLVKVKDIHIPADFVILDRREDRDESIVFGRPFLDTAKAIIDVKRGELVFRLHEDCILFKIPIPQSPSDIAGTIVQHIVFQPSLSVQSFTKPPNTNSKFSVGQPSSSTEKEATTAAITAAPPPSLTPKPAAIHPTLTHPSSPLLLLLPPLKPHCLCPVADPARYAATVDDP